MFATKEICVCFGAVTEEVSLEFSVSCVEVSGAEQTIKQPENFVPHYNTSEQQGSGWYGSGELLPTDPGNSKISGCSSNPLDDNLYKRQECEGINLVMKKNSTRPNIEITNKDPIIGENKKITGDPLPIVQKYGINLPFQADGSIGAVPADACSPVSIVTAPEYEERLCTNYKASEQYLCKQNLVVKVNPQFNYRCNDVLGVNSKESCDKTLKVDCQKFEECGGGINLMSSSGSIWKIQDAKQEVLSNGNIRLTWDIDMAEHAKAIQSYSNSTFWESIVLNVTTADISKAGNFRLVESNFAWGYVQTPYQDVFLNSQFDSYLSDQKCTIGDWLAWSWLSPGEGQCPKYNNNDNLVKNIDLMKFVKVGQTQLVFSAPGLGAFVGSATANRHLVIEYTPSCKQITKCVDYWQSGCNRLEERAK